MSNTKKRGGVAIATNSKQTFKTIKSLDRLKKKVANNPEVQKDLQKIFKKIEEINKKKLKAN